MTAPQSIAIHLPQYHPIPENDAWWGKGFTEWTNVVKARPRFAGHYQPHLPADLGFYDLRLAETLHAQANLARDYGLSGFCYYHYWFNGHRLLQRPLEVTLTDTSLQFPFMLCWANENWTRRWDGKDQEVLMGQQYSEADDRAHMQFLCERFFSDSRYIRVQGRPFFVVYKPAMNPDMKRTIEVWRETALKAGIGELYLGYMFSKVDEGKQAGAGFDCAIEFHPDFNDRGNRIQPTLTSRVKWKLGYPSVFHENKIFNYAAYADKMIRERTIRPGVFPGIMPMWDNSARRKSGANIFIDSTPEKYGQWLSHIVKEYQQTDIADKFIFINAWNEWAEGNHLEPCEQWGHRYLQATRDALSNA